MEKAKGISLWIIPENAVFKEIVEALGKKYNGPIFTAHLTLLGDIEKPKHEIILKTRQLCSLFTPFNVSVQDIDSLDMYFRCVFARAESDELIRLNDYAQRFFDRKESFIPHISLLYGYFSNDMKKKICSEISLKEKKFLVKDICIAHTDGYPHEWKLIERLPLGKV